MQFGHGPDLHLFLNDVFGAGHALLVTVEAVAQASENIALVVRCLYHLLINIVYSNYNVKLALPVRLYTNALAITAVYPSAPDFLNSHTH